MLRRIELGEVTVNLGKWRDPSRIKKLACGIKAAIDLDPGYFPCINEFMAEGEVQIPLGVVWGLESNLYFSEVDRMLDKQGFLERTNILHLASAIIPRADELWKLYLENKGPASVLATHQKSIWWNQDGIFMPRIILQPDKRILNAHPIDTRLCQSSGLLVVL